MRPSVLPAGMKLVGRVDGEGDLVVLGAIDGDVRVTGALVIEATGTVRGRVEARLVTVRGVLIGDADAADTVRVDPGARMVGDARAPRVNIVDGALYRGRLEMTDDGGIPRPARRSTASGGTRSPLSRSSAGTLSSPGTQSSPGALASPPRPTSPGYTPSPALGSSPGTISSAGVVISPVPLATPMPAPPSPLRATPASAPAPGRGTSPGTAASPDTPRMPRLGRVAARTDGAPR